VRTAHPYGEPRSSDSPLIAVRHTHTPLIIERLTHPHSDVWFPRLALNYSETYTHTINHSKTHTPQLLTVLSRLALYYSDTHTPLITTRPTPSHGWFWFLDSTLMTLRDTHTHLIILRLKLVTVLSRLALYYSDTHTPLITTRPTPSHGWFWFLDSTLITLRRTLTPLILVKLTHPNWWPFSFDSSFMIWGGYD